MEGQKEKATENGGEVKKEMKEQPKPEEKAKEVSGKEEVKKEVKDESKHEEKTKDVSGKEEAKMGSFVEPKLENHPIRKLSELKVTFGPLTEKNREILRTINKICLPVVYSNDFYLSLALSPGKYCRLGNLLFYP